MLLCRRVEHEWKFTALRLVPWAILQPLCSGVDHEEEGHCLQTCALSSDAASVLCHPPRRERHQIVSTTHELWGRKISYSQVSDLQQWISLLETDPSQPTLPLQRHTSRAKRVPSAGPQRITTSATCEPKHVDDTNTSDATQRSDSGWFQIPKRSNNL